MVENKVVTHPKTRKIGSKSGNIGLLKLILVQNRPKSRENGLKSVIFGPFGVDFT